MRAARLALALFTAHHFVCTSSLRQPSLRRPCISAAVAPSKTSRAPLYDGQSTPPSLSHHARVVRESVFRILEDDVQAFQLALRNEGERCARAIQRTAMEEAHRLSGDYRRHLMLLEVSQPMFSATRVLSATLSQPQRLALVIESYMHWRLPLVRWWAESWAMCAAESICSRLQRMATLAPGRLASASRRGSAGASRGRVASSLTSSPVPWRAEVDLQDALLHLRPQIVAKVRHAARHEPACLATFFAISLRLALLLPLWRLTTVLGVRAFALRRKLIRCALRDAARASARCSRVELRRQLLPVPPPVDARRVL